MVKPNRKNPPWDEEAFFEKIIEVEGMEGKRIAEEYVQWGRSRNLEIIPGKGDKFATLRIKLNHNGKKYMSLGLYAERGREFWLNFEQAEVGDELRRYCGECLNLSEKDTYPQRSFSKVDREALTTALDSAIESIKSPRS